MYSAHDFDYHNGKKKNKTLNKCLHDCLRVLKIFNESRYGEMEVFNET